MFQVQRLCREILNTLGLKQKDSRCSCGNQEVTGIDHDYEIIKGRNPIKDAMLNALNKSKRNEDSVDIQYSKIKISVRFMIICNIFLSVNVVRGFGL